MAPISLFILWFNIFIIGAEVTFGQAHAPCTVCQTSMVWIPGHKHMPGTFVVDELARKETIKLYT